MASDNNNKNTTAKPSSTADSYVGSLISLTSKSEIRYEGILYNINTDESSIGLQNVRSFGTEGRKKDGPQIPSSDKVYEYILFRGTDIKDLQVKTSPPPAQPTPTTIVNNDPAIIQSHYPNPMQTPPSSSLAATPSSVSGTNPMQDIAVHNGQQQHAMGFQHSMPPLYQPGGNVGAWGPQPPPPMYWQGFYPPPPNQLHQQSMMRPPMQQYPNFNAPLPSGLSLPEFLTPSSLPTSSLPSAPSASQASEISPPLLSDKAPIAAPLTLSQDTRAAETPLASAPFIGDFSSVSGDKPKPSLVTPDQLVQSGPASVPLSTPSQTSEKDVEVVQVSSSVAPNTSEPQPPILPLPASARPAHQVYNNGYRGRGRGGRGAGRSQQVMKFTEDFDFTAMNEKFNKDEVWGHLGKNTKDGDGEDVYQIEEEAELPNVDANLVYNKDDFFDSLSSNTANRDSQNVRPRFSEQRKLDTETFGEFSRFRGGRGYGRNGYSRGRGYGGRGGGGGGYGYGGQGGRGYVRGGVSNRTF